MPRMKTDDIDKFFEYGISLPTRTIYMGSMAGGDDESGVDATMAEYAVKGLHVLDQANNTADPKPIKVILSTIGGYVYHGMCIYDAIHMCRSYVTVTTFGPCMSMGSIILQAADKRIMTENSTLMIHYGTTGIIDMHAPTAYKWAEENKRNDIWMENLFLAKIREKHPKFTQKKLREWLMSDTFFTAEEAVHWGFADEVG